VSTPRAESGREYDIGSRQSCRVTQAILPKQSLINKGPPERRAVSAVRLCERATVTSANIRRREGSPLKQFSFANECFLVWVATSVDTSSFPVALLRRCPQMVDERNVWSIRKPMLALPRTQILYATSDTTLPTYYASPWKQERVKTNRA